MPTPPLASVVVVADLSVWTETTSTYLTEEGFLVQVDTHGEIAVDPESTMVDAVIVDLAFTRRSAIDVIAAWRSRSVAPILAVSHTPDEALVLDAFDVGADQIVMIDVSMRLVAARLRSLLRRTQLRRDRAATRRPRPITLDPELRAARLNGAVVELTEQEYAVLDQLVKRPDRVVRRSELAASGCLALDGARSLDFVVRRLREKLEAVDVGRRITAVRGVGFRLLTSVELLDLRDAPVDLTSEGSRNLTGPFTSGSRAVQEPCVPSLVVAHGEAG